jgi:WD40 repeat protein
LASGSEDKTVKLWSIESQKEVTTLQGHSSYVLSVAFSPDGKYLASGSNDNTVKLWSVESQKEIATLQGHSS